MVPSFPPVGHPRVRWAGICTVLLAGLASVRTATAPAIALELVADNLPYLVDIQHADASGRLFLVDQSGVIRILDGQVRSTPFLDLSERIVFAGERGLLGLAFHPSYASNGFFYVNYINTAYNTVIARFRVSADPNVADPDSETILLTVPQPFGNHKGGQLQFGPDGYLYIALGDGGAGGDPLNHGQNLDSLLGKLLRIDVDAASPYAIPAGNPYAQTPNTRHEIWSSGLRNPWRFSFDRASGQLFVSDVGQGGWEEINVAAAGTGGQNFGWRLMEGQHCFNPSSNCESPELVLPQIEYSHAVGCSIVGGYRYRGSQVAALEGLYVFGDLCSGTVWGASPSDGGTWRAARLLDTSLTLTTFGQDASGELYLSHYANPGELYRLTSGPASPRLSVKKLGSGDGEITTSPAGIECGKICAAQHLGGGAVTLTAIAAAGYSFGGWSGPGDCADGRVTVSEDITCTATFGAGFTDDPLVPGVSSIRAIHVTELRSRIDAARTSAGLSGAAWQEAITPAQTLVRASHIVEMRAALTQAFISAGRTPPSFSSLVAGATIAAVHVTELRQAVVSFEQR